MTWADLIADVRAQIGTTPDQAYAWLLDRARVMNAESGWLLAAVSITSGPGPLVYTLPADCLRVEAVLVNGYPYQRATLAQMDVARQQCSRQPLYGESVASSLAIEIIPAPQAGDEIVVRYVQDVPDNRTGSPPFPLDIHGALADGAIATGLARSDERFDSASYFEARFTDAIQRLKLRRHSRVGRGAVSIRVKG